MVLVVVSGGATDNTSSGGILTLPVCVFGAMLRSLFPGVLSINHKTTSAAATLAPLHHHANTIRLRRERCMRSHMPAGTSDSSPSNFSLTRSSHFRSFISLHFIELINFLL